jgi:hypothetical protein
MNSLDKVRLQAMMVVLPVGSLLTIFGGAPIGLEAVLYKVRPSASLSLDLAV